MTTSTTTAAEAAFILHALGAHIIPIAAVAGDVDASKKPIVSWQRYQQRQPTDDEISDWFTNGSERNIAVVAGAACGLVIVDTDSAEAEEWARENLPGTPWIVATAKGYHRYYLHPGEGVKIGNRAHITTDAGALALDLRGDGGYVVGPWSIHGSGAVYTPDNWPWEADDDVPIYNPDWFQPIEVKSTVLDSWRPPDEIRYPDTRDINWESVFAEANNRLVGEYEIPPDAKRGTCPICRHNGCFAALPESVNRWVCFSTGHPAWAGIPCKGETGQYGDLIDLHLFLSNGSWPDTSARVEYLRVSGLLAKPQKNASESPAVVETAADDSPDAYGTELWFARRLIAKHGRDIHYVSAWKKWLTWDGVRWCLDDTGAIYRMAEEITADILAELQELYTAAKQAHLAGDANAETEIEGRIAKVSKASQKFSGYTAIKNAVELAGHQAGVAVEYERLDADPWLLNCPNGTLDLREGTLREHRRVDLQTKVTLAEYREDADRTRWLTFLERVQPEEEVRAYLQRVMGVALIGEIRAHLLHIFFGGGQNGKTVFIETTRDVVGEYGYGANPDMLLKQKGQTHPADLAGIEGKRIVTAIEPEEGSRLNEQRVKMITGGDTFAVRRMREDFWELKPVCTLLLGTNHQPEVNDTGYGMWRRIRLVDWPVRIPDDEKEEGLAKRITTEGGQGVLSWMVEGCIDYLREGLNPPDCILKSTEIYKDIEDPTAEWIAKNIREDEKGFVSSKMLWDDYCKWANDRNISDKDRIGQKVLTKRIKTLFGGYTNYPKRGFSKISLEQTEDSSDWYAD